MNDLVGPVVPVAAARPSAARMLPQRSLDFLMIAIFVRIQHQRHAEAKTLIDGVRSAGFATPELVFAAAVVENALGNHEAALAAVRDCEVLEPASVAGSAKASRRVRMRSYIKARSKFALTGQLDEDGRAALEFYLRQGRKKRGTKPA